MPQSPASAKVDAKLAALVAARFDPLDLLSHAELPEKLIELTLSGPPSGPAAVTASLAELGQAIGEVSTEHCRVVVFGGGTGLSNIIGGDSRQPDWPQAPFHGLKEVFPQTRSIVCVTDDGGSTGELLKDLPLFAVGDLRHVLLSSIRRQKLQEQYGLSESEALGTAKGLHGLFNLRFEQRPASPQALLEEAGIDLAPLPVAMRQFLQGLVESLFADPRLARLLDRPHCLGNLLLVAAIYRMLAPDADAPEAGALLSGLRLLADMIGAESDAVLPATVTPARLKMLYANGVLVTGEYKSSEARRGYPVHRAFVEFAGEPMVLPEVIDAIRQADIILFAPGSLYSSIIPVLQVPGLAEAVRENRRALKVLIANLWVQRGETDLVWDDPRRRFYVSDLIAAYHRNIPNGLSGLFREIVVLGLRDIPGSVLQSYGLEGKVPIYLDREKVAGMGFSIVEAGVFSSSALLDRGVIQHDPAALAKAIHTLWATRRYLPARTASGLPACYPMATPVVDPQRLPPSRRLAAIRDRLTGMRVNGAADQVEEILWKHCDIPLSHLDYVAGVELVDRSSWCRSQQWDNVFSFYDPDDRLIKVCQDLVGKPERFEVAFLVALGQSLLGNYAGHKEMLPIEQGGERLGKMFRITLRKPRETVCFFTPDELDQYLQMVRMRRSQTDERVYSRLINGEEGFTPPGLLFGLTYAWYLDNRFASHIEYKMAITRIEVSDLVPEQVTMYRRRQTIIDFFRQTVFRQNAQAFDEGSVDNGGAP